MKDVAWILGIGMASVALIFLIAPGSGGDTPDRIEGLELRVRELERNQEKMVAISSILHQRIQMTEGFALTMLTSIGAVQTNLTKILDALTPRGPWVGDVQVGSVTNLAWKYFTNNVPVILTNKFEGFLWEVITPELQPPPVNHPAPLAEDFKDL